MSALKIITNIIYFGVVIAGAIIDIDNFQFHFIIALILTQVVVVYSDYVIINRKISFQAKLNKTTSFYNFEDLLLASFVYTIIVLLYNFLFKSFTTNYLVAIVSIWTLSSIFQIFITNGKAAPAFLLTGII